MVMHRPRAWEAPMEWTAREGAQGSLNCHLGTTLIHWDARPIRGAPCEHPGPGMGQGGEATVGRGAERPNSCPSPTLSSWPQMELPPRIQMLPPRVWGVKVGTPPKLLSSISEALSLNQTPTVTLEDHHGHLQTSSLRPCGQEAVAPGPKAGWPHCRDSHQTLGLAASLPGDGPTGRQHGEPRAQGHPVPLLST